ncbi:MAG: hypothetical protein RR620_12990 [Clostridium sp.]
MNIEFIVQNSNDGKAYDISDLVSDIDFTTEMEGNPGKLTCTINVTQNSNYVSEGSPVSFKVGNVNVFWGYVFKIKKSSNHELNITAYDQLRYLKSKDTYVFNGLTCDGIFKKICSDYDIKSKIVHTSWHTLPQRINDNKTLAEMIQYGFDKTLIDTGDWFMMRDNFGTLECLNVWEEKTDLAIGDESLLNDYNYDSDIEDSFNQVKLVKENKETKKRELYIVKDSSNMKRWGTLQFFETVNEDMNAAQIEERANMLLKHYNKIKKNLKLECIGDLRVKAGSGIVLIIKDLENSIPYNQYVIVNKVTHNFKNSNHTMSIEVKVV